MELGGVVRVEDEVVDHERAGGLDPVAGSGELFLFFAGDRLAGADDFGRLDFEAEGEAGGGAGVGGGGRAAERGRGGGGGGGGEGAPRLWPGWGGGVVLRVAGPLVLAADRCTK